MAAPTLPFDIVAFDLDGTLLDSRKRIPETAAAAIEVLRKRGARVTVASGRSAFSCLSFAAEIGADLPLVTHNGSLVCLPDGARIHHRAIPAATASRILDLAPAGVSPFFIQPDRAIHQGAPDLHVRAISAWGHRRYEEVARLADVGEPVTMLHMVGDRRSLERVFAGLTDADGVTGQMYPSERLPVFHLEIRAGADDKGTGLRRVAEWAGVPRERVMAIGDWLNDLPMLEYAGIAVAMRGSPAAVLARAHVVTEAPADEDGLARFLSGFLG